MTAHSVVVKFNRSEKFLIIFHYRLDILKISRTIVLENFISNILFCTCVLSICAFTPAHLPDNSSNHLQLYNFRRVLSFQKWPVQFRSRRSTSDCLCSPSLVTTTSSSSQISPSKILLLKNFI